MSRGVSRDQVEANFVLMFTVPDSLTRNKQYCNVYNQTLIHITFRVSLKQSKFGKARYVPIQSRKWLFVYCISGYASFIGRVQRKYYRCSQKTYCSSYTYHLYFCMPCITKTAVVSLSYSAIASQYLTMQLQNVHSLNGYCNSRPRTPTFRVKVSFTDELAMTSITNIHNEHVWSDSSLPSAMRGFRQPVG